MSVSSTLRKQQFPLDGITEDYTFNFRALTPAPEDIKCAVTTGGTDTILGYTTDYTVEINSDGIGGTVTLISPAAIGLGTLTVYRETTKKQESDYDDFNQFPANTLEENLDQLMLIVQEQSEVLERVIKLPITSTVTSSTFLLSNPVAGKALKWNDAADSLVNTDVDIDTAIAAALASQVSAATSATSAATYATTALTAQTAAQATVTIPINLQTGNYTLALDDVNKLVDLNSAGTITVTIPSSGSVNIPSGSVILLRQLGVGQVVITTASTVTINTEMGLKTTGRYSLVGLLKTSTDTWVATGALKT